MLTIPPSQDIAIIAALVNANIKVRAVEPLKQSLEEIDPDLVESKIP